MKLHRLFLRAGMALVAPICVCTVAGSIAAPAAHAATPPEAYFSVDGAAPPLSSNWPLLGSAVHFSPNADVRFDVQLTKNGNVNQGTGPTYMGFASADQNGYAVASISVPANVTYCGITCGYSATVRVHAFQYSSPQFTTPWQPLTLHSMPKFTLPDSWSGSGNDPNVYVRVVGWGYAPGGNMRVDVNVPGYPQRIAAWPTADSQGEIDETVTVPKSELYCGPACNHTETFSVDAWQYSGQQLNPGFQNVTIAIPPQVSAQQSGFEPGIYPSLGNVQATVTGSGLAPNGELRIELVDPAHPAAPYWGWLSAKADGTFTTQFTVPVSSIAPGCGGSTFQYQVFQYSTPQWFSTWQDLGLIRPGTSCPPIP